MITTCTARQGKATDAISAATSLIATGTSLMWSSLCTVVGINGTMITHSMVHSLIPYRLGHCLDFLNFQTPLSRSVICKSTMSAAQAMSICVVPGTLAAPPSWSQRAISVSDQMIRTTQQPLSSRTYSWNFFLARNYRKGLVFRAVVNSAPLGKKSTNATSRTMLATDSG